MTDSANVVKGFRQVVQDLLVPELRSIKTEIEYMKKAIDLNSEEIKSLRAETKEEIRALKTETKKAIDANSEEIKSLRTETRQEIKTLSDKMEKLTEVTLRLLDGFDTSRRISEFSERLAKVEQKLNL